MPGPVKLHLLVASLGLFILPLAVVSAQSLYTDTPLPYDAAPPYPYGFQINQDHSADNTFTLSSPSAVAGFTFVNFTDPGSTTTNVDWAITSGDYTGTTFASGTASVTDSFINNYTVGSPGTEYEFSNGTFSTPTLELPSGTYWLQLSNGVSSDSGPVYWQDILYGTSSGDTQTVYGLEGGNSAAFSVLGSPSAAPELPSAFGFAAGLIIMMVSLSFVNMRRRQLIDLT